MAQVTQGATTTRFEYLGARLIAERSASGTLLRRYVHGPGEDEPLLWYEGAGTSDRRYLHADERGSIIAVTNGTGAPLALNTYDEYGIPGAANQGRFQYTCQAWLAEAGLYHYKARVYSPTLGRFLQTDPTGYDDGPNLYAYVGNDPVNAVDPDGDEAYLIFDGRNLFGVDEVSRQSFFVRADSGLSGIRSSTYAGRIPNGSYSILAHPRNASRPPWYRLERHDDSFGDDSTPEGRTRLRLHGPGVTIGCIEVRDGGAANLMFRLLSNTTTSVATVNSSGLRGRLGATEQIEKYGTLRVVAGKGTLSYDKARGKVTYIEKTTETGWRIPRDAIWSCTLKDGKCN